MPIFITAKDLVRKFVRRLPRQFSRRNKHGSYYQKHCLGKFFELLVASLSCVLAVFPLAKFSWNSLGRSFQLNALAWTTWQRLCHQQVRLLPKRIVGIRRSVVPLLVLEESLIEISLLVLVLVRM